MGNPQTENGYIKIATELLEALCKIRINGEARQVLDFIIRKTYGWNKKEDHISFSQIEEGTGVNRRNSIRAIKKLKDMNLISVKKDTSFGNIYCINKKYKTWKGGVKNDTVVSKRVQSSVKTCKKVVSKTTHTIDTIQKTNTKDTNTGDKSPAQKTVNKNSTPDHVKFLENWANLYEKISGEKYKIDWGKDSKLVTDLIKIFGYDSVLKKSELLFIACQNKKLWFTKRGIADFTIGKLSSKWNEILESTSKDAADIWLENELKKDGAKNG